LLHPTLPAVVGRLASLAPRPELSLTTNGIVWCGLRAVVEPVWTG